MNTISRLESKQRYKFLFFIPLIFFISATVTAQTNTGTGKITAKVVDAQNNQTVPFATAVILNRRTKATVKVGQTDADGNLTITGLPNGVFTFKISYVGYQTMVRDSVSLSPALQLVHFGTIKMKVARGTVLNEVNVTAKKSTMQLGIDKKIFSVDQSLVSEGGSAADLLQNVPSVQTDMDGNVSLRGSTGVKVLIDGKASLIAGGDVAQILQSIPASSIETVEVITNPSSKYDAEGQSGIINIVLKKNSKLGLNGSLALTAGNRENYNANTSLSFQNKKVNLYGNYGYKYGNRPGGGFNNISYLQPRTDGLAFAEQLTNSTNLDKNHNIKAGIDYYLTNKDIVSLSGAFNSRASDGNDFLKINKYTAQKTALEQSNRINTNDRSGNSYDLNMDYSHKFKPAQELTMNFGYSNGINDNFQQYNTSDYVMNGLPVTSPVEMLTNTNNGDNKNYNIQADYTMPMGKLGKLEAGYRSQIKYSNNYTLAQEYNEVSGEFDQDFLLSNTFSSKDQVHALYANYQNQLKNFGYQIGLRGEAAKLNTSSGAFNRSNDLVYTPGKIAYNRLYPSIFLTQKFKGEQQVQLSYTRRVNRPRPWDTNPFTDYSDPLTWRQGNPSLLPEDAHAFELSYSKFWQKVSFIGSAYLRKTNDMIQRVRTQPNDDGIIIITPYNLTKGINSGLELISKVDVIKAWNFTANANVYHSKIDAVPAFNITGNSGYSWNANLTNNFTLPYNVTLQIKGDYSSREIQAQGKRKPMYGLDAGAKYDFMNKKASLSLNVRDLFNTRKWAMNIADNYSITDFQRYMKGPTGNLTFSYRFGKTTFMKKPKKQEQQDMRPDEGAF